MHKVFLNYPIRIVVLRSIVGANKWFGFLKLVVFLLIDDGWICDLIRFVVLEFIGIKD